MDQVFAEIESQWGKMDFLVHAIAYSDKDELKGKYLNTSRANFSRTMDISCYSFTALARRAASLMTNGGAMVTLTFSGAERVVPNYNVMGVAKAALEASINIWPLIWDRKTFALTPFPLAPCGPWPAAPSPAPGIFTDGAKITPP